MARLPRGKEVLPIAQKALAKTHDANELRVLQAVILPLVYNFSTEETARAVGRGKTWVTVERNKFIREAGFKREKAQPVRNHAYMTLEEEKKFLAPFIDKARCGGILVANEIHRALEEHLGHPVALSTAYNLLHRHGWRKLAPDKRNVESNVQEQEDWKKNFQNDLPKSEKNGRCRGRSG